MGMHSISQDKSLIYKSLLWFLGGFIKVYFHYKSRKLISQDKSLIYKSLFVL